MVKKENYLYRHVDMCIYMYIYIYVYIYIYICDFSFFVPSRPKWRFPKIGVSPNHPYFRWSFHCKPSIWGGAPTSGNPHLTIEQWDIR